MPVTPFDIQMLFAQVDKLSKDTVAQKEGAELHRAMEASIQKKINDEKVRSVQEAESSEKNLDKLNQGGSGGGGNGSKKKGRSNKEGLDGRDELPQVQDPNIGKYLNLSG